jgi:predicted acylesterase/phospholipase RssA
MASSTVATATTTTKTFLLDYLTEAEITRNLATPTRAAVTGKAAVFDCPIKSIDSFLAKACSLLNLANYGRFPLIVANEGGAILGALLAVGYTPIEILNLRSDGTFNPISLIEDGQVLPNALHITTSGAQHKGKRMREALDTLLRAKIGGRSSDDVTFADLTSSTRGSNFNVTALNITTGAVEVLGNETYPAMVVADAVLASCAVQPYIASLSYKDEAGTTHQLMACSVTQTLPAATALSMYSKFLSGMAISNIVGYGWAGTASGVASTSGDPQYKYLTTQRAAAAIPKGMVNVSLL